MVIPENDVVKETKPIETEEVKKEKIAQILKERIVQYNDLANSFSESIDTYKSLIAVIMENKTRFKKYADLMFQFTSHQDSFKTQRKNTLKAVRKFEKILKNLEKYTAAEILEALKI